MLACLTDGVGKIPSTNWKKGTQKNVRCKKLNTLEFKNQIHPGDFLQEFGLPLLGVWRAIPMPTSILSHYTSTA